MSQKNAENVNVSVEKLYCPTFNTLRARILYIRTLKSA